MIGQTVSHYAILEKLGGGGMGLVFKAEDTKLKRPVALKFLPLELTQDAEAKQRFIHEAQAASALDHPNICTVHEIAETADGQMFIVMGFYQGETLKKKIDRGPLEISQAIDIAAQVAEGLGRAHEAGIVHRDIKPANIMITDRNEVKIVDFGLAKLTGQTVITRSGSTLGTMAYMSPEQTRGQQADRRTDIWSLGVVLYEMIAGRRPFESNYEQAVIYSILYEDPPRISSVREGVPESVVHVAQMALAKRRENRYQRVDDLLTDLKAIKEGKRPEIASSPESRRKATQRAPRPVFGRSPSMSRRLLLPFSLALIVVLAALAWYAWSTFISPSLYQEKKWRMAVLPFLNLTGDSSANQLTGLMQMLFVGNLTGGEDLGVVDASRFRAPSQTPAMAMTGQQDPEVYKALQNQDVDYVLEGALHRFGGTYMIHSKLVSPATMMVAVAPVAEFRTPEELVPAATSISKQVVDYLDAEVLNRTSDKDLRPWLSHGAHNVSALKAFVEGTHYVYRGQPGAERYMLEAIELDSAFMSPRIWLIPSLVYRGKKQDALKHYQVLRRLEPAASPFDKAMIDWVGAYIDGNLPAQVRALEVALKYSPNNNILLVNIAGIYHDEQEYQRALDLLKPVVDARWYFPLLYPLYGKCLVGMQRYDEAREVLEDALTIEPVSPETYGVLASLMIREKDSSKATQYEDLCFRSFHDGGGDWGSAYAEIGSDLLGVGLHEEAAGYFQKAIVAYPRRPAYHSGRGDALQLSGQLGEAATEYNKALQLDSNWVPAHRMLGRIREGEGKTAEALRHYRLYLARDSTSKVASDIRRKVASISSFSPGQEGQRTDKN